MIKEFENISLAGRNSFGVEQAAARLVEFETVADLREIFADKPPQKWAVLAGGNNILFTQDFNGTLLTPVCDDIDISGEGAETVMVNVGAGVEWDDLVEWAVGRGLWGMENLSLIPGKVGAAPVQNVGAYGREAKDVIENVEMFCPDTMNTLILNKEHCRFGYRDSIFKHELRGRVIITSLTVRLSKVPAPDLDYGDLLRETQARGESSLRNIRDAVCAIRRSKLPDPKIMGNAGSFFKNPVVDVETAVRLKSEFPDMPTYSSANGVKLAAGWLIDRTGLKGLRRGRVGIHEKQALVVVNLGGATGSEIVGFACEVQQTVYDKFGVRLEMEVNIL